MNHEERQKRIAEAAYYRSLRRGLSGDDHQLDDWLAAEREVAAMGAEPEQQPEDQAIPPQPDQTSGVAIPAPLAKEDKIRADEVKQSARDLVVGREEQSKPTQESKPSAKKTRKRRDGRSTAELRRSV